MPRPCVLERTLQCNGNGNANIKLQALVYDTEEGAGKRCSECPLLWCSRTQCGCSLTQCGWPRACYAFTFYSYWLTPPPPHPPHTHTHFPGFWSPLVPLQNQFLDLINKTKIKSNEQAKGVDGCTRDRQTDRQTGGETDRHTQRHRETHTHTQKHRETQRQRQGQTETETERHPRTQRQRDRQTARQRQRDRGRETHT